MANQLGGSLTTAQRSDCQNNKETSQAEQLNTLLTNAELAAANDDSTYLYYWQRRETDAWDHTLSETLGNGLVNTYHHNANTGRPDYIATHKASQLFSKGVSGYTATGRNLRLIEYKYDNHDNVTYRYDQFLGIRDAFEYDGLDRVTNNSVVLDTPDKHLAGNPDFNGPFAVQYDKLGNIKQRSEIGDYTYSGVQAGPHAVTQANGLTYQYDDVGNMVSAKAVAGTDNAMERELEWNAFNKPTKITRNGKTVEFKYYANHSRYLKTNSDGVETFYFDKTYERVKDTTTGEVQHKHFVYADGKLIALNTQTRDSEDKLKDKQVRYLHYDALQSVDMITDGYGVVVERRSYNVWGKQRKVIWQEDSTTSVQLKIITNRGYTGHEQIEEVGLTHMNGRVYDEEVGRFISADPIVQAPFVTNSFNRYAYVWNNPLKYRDPSGFVARSHYESSLDYDPILSGADSYAEHMGSRYGSTIEIQQPHNMGSSGNLFGAAVAAAIHAVAASSLQDEIGNIQQSKPEDVDEPLDADNEIETKYHGEPTQFDDDDIVSVELRNKKHTNRLGGAADGHGITITLEDGTEIDVEETRAKEKKDDPFNPSGRSPVRFKHALSTL
ncbi:hypothetical protein A1OO_19335 [Enterovibrio norvegicus FF-33]|nr:hypothetical protein A1OO_19335 [Enterovibrio norvegicus FF-33]